MIGGQVNDLTENHFEYQAEFRFSSLRLINTSPGKRKENMDELNNAIDKLIKWKDDHKFCLMAKELNSLNNIIDDLTDRYSDLKNEKNGSNLT